MATTSLSGRLPSDPVQNVRPLASSSTSETTRSSAAQSVMMRGRRKSGVVVGERQRSVGEAHREIGAHPVEHRHEVVTQHAHAGRANAANALGVVVDQSIAHWAAELDVLVHGNALDYRERKASLVD